mmetsp:Transcript_14447/g.36159  ORF Transcript_14447/g.36159 Transcript_14447/m.36159 type:complete len:1310 (-) Transcript_14447:933-4862(-)|eukprot:CAMPEP_0178993572 /NCGR_PEP_ID=MMETSP0795-20121207/6778_1 /TAXON_ID=88552 /ORGANISM="Amoebophrya sp., Strain Ameob2" /LENGTH=1309 /DNA_ID=CAMNT_0020685647 /DNA_START=352 /DNA_END=4281 /DNA_ORIENTATION=+
MPIARKDRTHHTGASNRETNWKPIKGVPTDFDSTMRSTLPREYTYKLSRNVPLMQLTSNANTDFEHTLPGAQYRKGETLEDTQVDLFNQTREFVKEKVAKKQEQEMLNKTGAAGAENGRGTSLAGTLPGGAGSQLLGQELLGATASLPSKIVAPRVESMKAVPAKLPHDKAQKVLPSLEAGHHVLPGTVQSLPRWNARSWWEPLSIEIQPKIKSIGDVTWNSLDSHYLKRRKGQDYLFRATRTQQEADAENEEAEKRDLNRLEEYYPRRELVDTVKRLEPGNDAQVRPVYLPDFAYYMPGRTNAEMKSRVERLRGVLRQKYGGRPGLNKVFRAFANVKPGFLLPKDFHSVLDKMGIKTDMRECELLIQAVDRTEKGAITFEEFSDLVYSPLIEVGRGAEDAVERHTQAITQNILDILVERGPYLGKAFCDVDAGRNYFINKEQFSNAIGTACNHLSDQAIDFLWAAQFPISGNTGNMDPSTMSAVVEKHSPGVDRGGEGGAGTGGSSPGKAAAVVETGSAPAGPSSPSRPRPEPVAAEERLEMVFTKQTKALDKKEQAAKDKRQEKRREKIQAARRPPNPFKEKIDWTLFMKQLTDYVMSMRPMTPVYYQGKKRHYDLVQRTAALTGGTIPDLDLNRPTMDAKTQIQIVADKLVMKERNLANMPSEVAMQTVNYNEAIRTKAYAARRAIYHNISKDRFKYLCNGYEQIPRQGMIDMLFNEIEAPGSQRPYVRPGGKLPEGYESPRVEPPEIERVRDPEHVAELARAVYGPSVLEPKGRSKKAAHISCQPADIEAWIGCEFGNNVDLVAPTRAWNMVEKQNEDLLAQFDDSRDGLNRALRQLRPMRQRPRDSFMSDEERKRLENQDVGQARTSASSTQDRRREREEEGMAGKYQEDIENPMPAYRNYWQARFVMELITDGLEKVENGASGKLRNYKAFKRLDHDGDCYITLNDLEKSFQQFKIAYTPEDVHAVFSELDTADRGSVDIGQFSRRFATFQGSLLDNMQRPISMVAFDGTAPVKVGPVVERERAEAAYRGDGLQQVLPPLPEEFELAESAPGVPQSPQFQEGGATSSSAAAAQQQADGADAMDEASADYQQQDDVPSSRTPPAVSSPVKAASEGGNVMSPPDLGPYEALEDMMEADDVESRAGDWRIKPLPRGRGMFAGQKYGSITQVIKARTDRWKPKKSELYTTLPPGRYQRTQYPETAHVTQPISHETIASYLPEERRFKTMALSHNIYAVPDVEIPARMDRLKSMAIRDFRVKRIQYRQEEISRRKEMAEESAREFEEKRIARKALNQLNYERKIRATS